MALVLLDRAKETTTVVGTGTATLLGAVTSYQSLAGVGNGNTTYYCIVDQVGANWEVGIGTYSSSGTTLARTTVLASSNAGALVVFTTGVKDVFVTYPSEKGVWYDASGNVLFTGTTTAANLTYTGTLTGSTGILNIGSGQLYKDASGNVGIGTSSPSTISKFAVLGSNTTVGTTETVATFLNGAGGSSPAVIRFGNLGNNSSGIGNTIESVGYAGVALYTNTASVLTERMRINSSGNVGIGTSSPLVVTNQTSVNVNGTSASRYELLVGGTRTSYVYTDAAAMQVGSITTIPVQFMTAGTERMRIDASGKVGIGTSSPSAAGLNITSGAGAINAGQLLLKFTGYTGGIALTQGSVGEAYLYNVDNSYFAFGTNNLERMRIDASGNVGIGGTPANGMLELFKTSGEAVLRINNTVGNAWLTLNGASAGYIHNVSNTPTVFTTNSTERMRLDSSGNLLVGTTSVINGSNAILQAINVNGGRPGINVGNSVGSSVTNCVIFTNSNGTVGSIQTSGSATSYVTSSDYRLKENIAPMTGALDKVAQLKPVAYSWKVDGSIGEGFIAHELAEVCPHAVTGEKDAVDAEGKPQYQGIDTSFLVATLTAAIQELKAIIDTQQEQINSLLGK